MRNRTTKFIPLIFIAGLLSLPAIFPFYRLSPYEYFSDLQVLGRLILRYSRELLLGVLISVPVILVGSLLSKEAWVGRWVWASRRITPIMYRCIGQMLGGVVILYFAYAAPELCLLLLSIALSIFLLSEYSRLHPLPTFKPILRGIADRWIGSAAVEEGKIYMSSFFYLLGTASSLLLFPSIAVHCIVMGSFVDPISGLVDERVNEPRIPYSPHKTLLGFLTFFLSGCFAMYLLGMGLNSIYLSLTLAFLESLCVRGADNFVVPFATGLFLKCFGGI